MPRGHLSLGKAKTAPKMPKLWRPNLFKRRLPWFMRFFRRIGKTTAPGAKPPGNTSGVMKGSASQGLYPTARGLGHSGGLSRGNNRGLARKERVAR